jgi:phosphate starvation-inducible PhoH-like protein
MFLTQMSKSIKIHSVNHFYKPKSLNQQNYINAINNENVKIVAGIGPAGCGKTLFACLNAVNYLKNNKVEKIILTRPIVSVDEELGFLPGNINKKMDPWTKPMFDIFSEFYKKQEIDNMVHNNVIEIAPLGLMRGRTFKNSIIIADEMQNSLPSQMFMLTTRIGENSKMIITGDLLQSDLKVKNGLQDFIEKYNHFSSIKSLNNIDIIKFENSDIERSQIVKTILEMYH